MTLSKKIEYNKYQIKGIVTDSSSGQPIDGVEVKIKQMDGGVLAHPD